MYFAWKNTGDISWIRQGLTPNPVNLATAEPNGARNSAFVVNGAWMNAMRPTSITSGDVVAPGAIGRFDFPVVAPAGLGTYHELFTLVAEGLQYFGQGVYLDWTVIPAIPPIVALVDTPSAAHAGGVLSVQARATDNNAVASVTAKLGTAAPVAMTTSGDRYAAVLPTDGLTTGDYDLTVTATDPGGRTAVASQTVHVTAAPAAAVPAPPAATPDTPEPQGPGCASGTVSFDTPKGGVCAPPALAAFVVGGVAQKGKLIGAVVSPTVKDQIVSIRCTQKCAKRHGTVSVKTHTRATAVKLKKVGIKIGSVIEIVIQKNGATTRYQRYTVLRRYPFLGRGMGGCRPQVGVDASC